MSELRDIKRRIKSVTGTAKITRAMQNISTSRLLSIREVVKASKTYVTHLNKLIEKVPHTSSLSHPINDQHKSSHLVVLMTSNKGLCGSLNQNLFRKIITLDPNETYYLTIGGKGEQYLAKNNLNAVKSFHYRHIPTFEDCVIYTRYCLKFIKSHQIQSFSILFPNFVNALVQNPELRQVYPIEETESYTSNVKKNDEFTICEPPPHKLIKKLIPTYVHANIYQTLLNARASEFSARMRAMKEASDKSDEIIASLKLQFNKIRQQAITNEIIQISTAKLSQQ